MTEIDYDLAIGSGPGGYVAAIKAAQLNMVFWLVKKRFRRHLSQLGMYTY